MDTPLAPGAAPPQVPPSRRSTGSPGAAWSATHPANDPTQPTPTEQAAARLFVNSDPSGVYSCTSPLARGAARCLGRWWELQEATRARAGLDEVLAASPSPAWSVVQDLVHFVPSGEPTDRRDAAGWRVGTVLRRRTAFATGAAPPQRRDKWREDDTSQKPSALLLTAVFADTPVAGATLTLRTLFLEDTVFEVPPEALLREVFGARTPALSAPTLLCSSNDHLAPTTDVEIDGETVSAAQLAELPQRARRAVAAVRRAQLLHALRECLGAARWPGGFLALRYFATELVGVGACLWTEPLAVLLLRARTGGAPSFPLVQALEFWAGAHIQAEQFEEGVALLRTICETHQEAAQQHGFWTFGPHFHPPTVWHHLGNGEAHLRNYAAAIAAYRRGMAALDVA
jgi:hypothetical protein